MLRCPAKLQSVVAMLTFKVIFYMAWIFTKIKFLIFFSMRSFLLPLHSLFLKISIQFPTSRNIFLYLGVVPKWPRNLKNVVFEHFGTNYLDIVVLLTIAQILKTSSIQWNLSHNLAAAGTAGDQTGAESDNFDFSIYCECREWSQNIILWKINALIVFYKKTSGMEIFGVIIS